jgi:PLD-like domain
MTTRTRNLTNQSAHGPAILFGAFLLLVSCALCCADTTGVRYIPARDYFQTVLTEINNAQRSIHVVLYLFSLYPNSPNSKAMRLAQALVAAHKRGVAVEVVLDAQKHGDPVEAGDNSQAYNFLTGRGVHACFADVPAIVHAKAVIIDSQTVIVGSANWSESAFDRNIEASVLVRDRTVAAQILAELGQLPTTILVPGDSVYAKIPLSFVLDTSALGRMVTSQDERAFDLYLFLCGAAGGKQGTFTTDYDTIARYLGISSMSKDDYRRQINKTLTKLMEKYALVSVKLQTGNNAEVALSQRTRDGIEIPERYFTCGWRGRLDFSSKVMYCLGLYYSSVSLSRPQWSMSAETIAQRHGLSRWFVTEGVTALRRANLLDIVYDKVPRNDDTLRRHANIYIPLPIYDPAKLDSAWAALEIKDGKEKTDRARQCAALVYKDCDFRAVEQFIALEDKYGLDKMNRAKQIIAQKSPDNPRRTVGYFIATVMATLGSP